MHINTREHAQTNTNYKL